MFTCYCAIISIMFVETKKYSCRRLLISSVTNKSSHYSLASAGALSGRIADARAQVSATYTLFVLPGVCRPGETASARVREARERRGERGED